MRTARPKRPWHKPAEQEPARPCEWPGCDGDGEHRAPKSRDELDVYRWFCLDHVRQYNKSWNYYAGMDESQVEADRRRDTVWHRPTWRMGGMGPRSVDDMTVDDPVGVYSERMARGRGAQGRKERPQPGMSAAEERAMRVMELTPPLDAAALKARYKELVKIHHPDANNGAKEAEERFKAIVEAYHTLMECLDARSKRAV